MVSLPVRWNLTEVLFYLDTGLALSKSDLKSQKKTAHLIAVEAQSKTEVSYFPFFEFKFPD